MNAGFLPAFTSARGRRRGGGLAGRRQRSDIRSDRDDVVGREFGDRHFHQLDGLAISSALLNVPQLPRNVAWRTADDWRAVNRAHQVFTMTRDTRRVLTGNELRPNHSGSARRDKVLA